MTTDAWLAIAHHLAVFGVGAVLAAEWALLRPGLDAPRIERLARIDSAYGALAAIVLAAGFGRVFLGAKPASFYLDSTTFWLKIAAFAGVGLLSIRPTIGYLRWRKATRIDPASTPTDEAVAQAHRAVNTQIAVFTAIPVLAALMARGIGA
jgi:putative membrane protein